MGVISYINSWLKDIVVLFILISIAELIMPKGNLKKYIRVVIGLLVIFTIINPFTKLFHLDFSLDKVVFNYAKPEIFNSSELEAFYKQQEKQIEKIYIKKVYDEFKNLIETETEYELIDADISIIRDEDKYGEIDSAILYIKEKKSSKNNGKISIEKIDPIEIGHSISKETIDSSNYENIKILISENYGIEKDRINIKFK